MATANNKLIAKNTVFLSIRMVLILLISLYTSKVFLQVLGTADYGVVNVVAGFVSMFMFLNTALTNGIQRFYNYELGANGAESLGRVYTTALLIQLLLSILVVVLLESVGLWYIYKVMVIPPERFTPALYVFHFSVLSSVFVIMKVPYSAAVMAFERMNFFAMVEILDVLLKLGFAFLLPYMSQEKMILYGLFFLLTAVINFLLYYVYVKINFKTIRLKLVFYKELFYKMINFSGWAFSGSFACMIREQGLNLLLNVFFGPIVNAARAIAYQVSSALQSLVQNLSIAATPQMVQAYALGNESRSIKLMLTMSKFSFFFLYVIAVPVVLEIDYLLNLWLGDIVPEYTGIFIAWIILVNFINNLNAPLSSMVFATGKIKNYEITFSAFNLSILPVSWVALKIGAPATSVFIIYFTIMIFAQSACLYCLHKLVKFSLYDYWRFLVVPLIIASLISLTIPFVIHQIMEVSIVRLLFVTVATLLFSTVVFYMITLSSEEKTKVNGYLKRVLKIA